MSETGGTQYGKFSSSLLLPLGCSNRRLSNCSIASDLFIPVTIKEKMSDEVKKQMRD